MNTRPLPQWLYTLCRKSGGLWSNSDRSSRNKNARDQMKEDSRLLWDARQNVGKGGKKMDRKQYAAMRRKVGGTARDYFKDWVDVDGAYQAAWLREVKTSRVFSLRCATIKQGHTANMHIQ